MKIEVLQLDACTSVPFSERLDCILIKYRQALNTLGKPARLVWSRAFLSDAANQLDELFSHSLYDALKEGAFSYVEQPPLNGCKIVLLIGVTTDDIQVSGTPEKRIIISNGERYLFQSVRFTKEESVGMTPKQQTRETFARHIQWLREEGLNLRDNCHRTWLYVRDIDTNYQQVVDGRNEIFDEEGLTKTTHFIASTGIEGNSQATAATVGIDFWSVDAPDTKVKYLTATNYLNPTHEYGVAFERGTKIQIGDTTQWLISGTASIDNKGMCIHVGDVKRQAERLLLNIEKLLEDGNARLDNIRWMTVYLRDISDSNVIEAYLRKRFPKVIAIIVEARVCRPAWLIEIEAVAYINE